MRNISDQAVEKSKTHISCSNFLFRKSCRSWNNLENYCRAGLTTDDGMTHTHCITDA